MGQFKLQTVLDYRAGLVNRAEKELLDSLARQEALSAEKTREEREVARLGDELRAAKQNAERIEEILYCEDCVRFGKRRLRGLEEQLRISNSLVEQKNLELVQARQGKKTLEILKEKQTEEARRIREHQDRVFMDEVAVLRFGGGK